MFELKREYVTGKRGRLHNEKLFMICTPHQILFGWSKMDGWDGRDVLHVWGDGSCK